MRKVSAYATLQYSMNDTREKIKKEMVLVSDPNYQFLSSYLFHKADSVDRSDTKQLKRIEEKVSILTIEERQQWVKTYHNSCNSIAAKLKTEHSSDNSQLITRFKHLVVVLVFVCKTYHLSYDTKHIETLIKQVFFREQGKSVLPLFSKAGYSVDEFQLLKYQEGIIQKICSCFFMG